MSRERLVKLLQSSDREIGAAENLLARAFRSILFKMNFTDAELDNKMRTYLEKPENGFSYDKKKMSSERSNLMKNLVRPKMTFPVFLKAVVKFLSPYKTEIIVRVWHNKHNYTEEMMTICNDETLKAILDAEEEAEPDPGNEVSQWKQDMTPLPTVDFMSTFGQGDELD